MNDRARHILDFWFGDSVRDPAQVSARGGLWWSGARIHDDAISVGFSDDVALASAGAFADWTRDAHERLALILLLDQFRRSLFRGTAAAFALDATALGLTQGGIALGHDRELAPIERVFLYMPLEHAESADVQAQSVACFEALEREVPEAQRALFADFTSFAREHRDIVVRFGRFPHRNAVLGRANTAQEAAYLNGGGRTFGQ